MRKFFLNHFVLISFSALILCGCSMTERDPQLVASPDKVSLRLAEAADKASNALQTLAAVEQSRSPGIAVDPIVGAPPELQRAITINWIGPAEQLSRRLAERAGYDFLAIGDRPPVALVVNVNVENQRVIDVLRSVGLQLGSRADVKVDSTRRLVEIHYAPVSGIGG